MGLLETHLCVDQSFSDSSLVFFNRPTSFSPHPLVFAFLDSFFLLSRSFFLHNFHTLLPEESLSCQARPRRLPPPYLPKTRPPPAINLVLLAASTPCKYLDLNLSFELTSPRSRHGGPSVAEAPAANVPLPSLCFFFFFILSFLSDVPVCSWILLDLFLNMNYDPRDPFLSLPCLN